MSELNLRTIDDAWKSIQKKESTVLENLRKVCDEYVKGGWGAVKTDLNSAKNKIDLNSTMNILDNANLEYSTPLVSLYSLGDTSSSYLLVKPASKRPVLVLNKEDVHLFAEDSMLVIVDFVDKKYNDIKCNVYWWDKNGYHAEASYTVYKPSSSDYEYGVNGTIDVYKNNSKILSTKVLYDIIRSRSYIENIEIHLRELIKLDSSYVNLAKMYQYLSKKTADEKIDMFIKMFRPDLSLCFEDKLVVFSRLVFDTAKIIDENKKYIGEIINNVFEFLKTNSKKINNSLNSEGCFESNEISKKNKLIKGIKLVKGNVDDIISKQTLTIKIEDNNHFSDIIIQDLSCTSTLLDRLAFLGMVDMYMPLYSDVVNREIYAHIEADLYKVFGNLFIDERTIKLKHILPYLSACNEVYVDKIKNSDKLYCNLYDELVFIDGSTGTLYVDFHSSNKYDNASRVYFNTPEVLENNKFEPVKLELKLAEYTKWLRDLDLRSVLYKEIIRLLGEDFKHTASDSMNISNIDCELEL